MSKTSVNDNNRENPDIPTSVLLTEVYGELGTSLGWSLERTKFHLELSMVIDLSDNTDLSDYMQVLEILVQNNPTTLLTDLTERREFIKNEYFKLRALLTRVLRQRTNIGIIDGATNKDLGSSMIHTGIVYLLENSKICDTESVNILNTLILGHPNVKSICKNLLLAYTKTIIVTDVLVKCLLMAKMTGQIGEESKQE